MINFPFYRFAKKIIDMSIYRKLLSIGLLAGMLLTFSCGPNAEEKAKEKAKAEQDQKKTDSNVDSLANSMGAGNDAKVGPAHTTKKATLAKDK